MVPLRSVCRYNLAQMSRANLFANVKARRAEYLAIADAYDSELATAHNAGDRTTEAVVHLNVPEK